MREEKILCTWLDEHQKEIISLAKALYENPEVANEEVFACEETAAFLERNGFQNIQKLKIGKANKENCVIARWGSGHPIVGILGEYDALPGLGQDPVPYYSPKEGPGHACGHNLMGAACAAAAAATRYIMEREQLSGTLVYYACPAEETLEGKIYMCREHMFDELDVCSAWHAGGELRVAEFIVQACRNLQFDFHGIAAHAACAPELGRSALDAAELMNVGVQYLREHVKDGVRIHYRYLSGGKKANIVPDFASLEYLVRAENQKENREIIDRLIKIANGAAMMTETSSEVKYGTGSYESILNHTLNRAMHQAASNTRPIVYTEEERIFAKELYANATGVPREECLPITQIQPLLGKGYLLAGATDVSDVSWNVPTVQLFGQGGVFGPELGGHHWCQVVTSGMSIGHKGAMFAAEALARFSLDIFENPQIAEEAQKEFRRTMESKEEYVALIGDEMA